MRASSLAPPSIALLILLGAGCDALSYYPEDCADELRCPGDPCPGECVPLPPLGFDGPALLWIGPESEAPECPARAPQNVYEGHDSLQASHECPPCECSQPTCQFPAGIDASNTTACQGPDFTPFEAPADWSGACTAADPVITSNELRSVTIEPVTERPCEPVPPDVAEDAGPLGWGLFARACRGEAITAVCSNPGLTCLPSAEPPPPGFQQCIMYLGPNDDPGIQCPEEYPEMHVFFTGVEDTRACTECTCTQTAPSTCAAWITSYQSGACSQPIVGSMITTDPICLDVPQGVQLGSMDASWLTNEPGSCQAAGGEPIGEIKPKNPRTFCCQPPRGV